MATVRICRGTGTKKDTGRKVCRGTGKLMSRVKDRSICRDSCRVRDKGRGRWTVDKSRNSLSISSMAKNMWLEGSQVQHSMMPDDFFLALTRQVMPQFLRFWPIF